MIEQDGKVIPIEVKSGKDYDRHNALKNVTSSEAYSIERAYVFCSSNVKVDGVIVYMPIYMTMFLHKQRKAENQIYLRTFLFAPTLPAHNTLGTSFSYFMQSHNYPNYAIFKVAKRKGYRAALALFARRRLGFLIIFCIFAQKYNQALIL